MPLVEHIAGQYKKVIGESSLVSQTDDIDTTYQKRVVLEATQKKLTEQLSRARLAKANYATINNLEQSIEHNKIPLALLDEKIRQFESTQSANKSMDSGLLPLASRLAETDQIMAKREEENRRVIQELTSKRDQLQASKDQLDTQLAKKEAELTKLRELSDHLPKERSQLEVRIQKSESDLASLKASYDSQLVSKNSMLTDISSKRDALQHQLEDKQAEVASLHKQVDELTATIKNTSGQIQGCQSQIQQITSSATSQIQDLQMKLSQTQAQYTELTNAYQAEFMELNNLRQKSQSDDASLATCKSNMSQFGLYQQNANAEKAALTKQLADLQQQTASLSSQLAALSKEKEAVQAAHESLATQGQNLSVLQRQSDQQLVETNMKLASIQQGAVQERVAHLAEKAGLVKQNLELTSQQRQVEEQLQMVGQQSIQLNAQNKQLADQLAGTTEQVGQLQKQLATIQSTQADKEQVRIALQTKIDTLQSSLDQSLSRMGVLETQLKQVTALKEEAAKTRDALDSANQAKDSQLAVLQSEISTLIGQKKDLENQLASISQLQSQSSTSLTDLQSQLSQLQKKEANVEQERDQLRVQLTEEQRQRMAQEKDLRSQIAELTNDQGTLLSKQSELQSALDLALQASSELKLATTRSSVETQSTLDECAKNKENLSSQLSSLQLRLNETNEKLERAQSDLQGTQSADQQTNKDLLAQINDLEEHITSSQAVMRSQRQQYDEIIKQKQDQLQLSQAEVARLDQLRLSLESSNKATEQSILSDKKSREATINDLQAQLEQFKTSGKDTIDQLQQSLQESKAEGIKLQKEADKKVEECSSKLARLQASSNPNVELQRQLSDLTKQSQADSLRLASQTTELNKVISQLQEKSDVLTQKQSEYQIEMEKIINQKSELEHSLSEIRAQHEATVKTSQEQIDELGQKVQQQQSLLSLPVDILKALVSIPLSVLTAAVQSVSGSKPTPQEPAQAPSADVAQLVIDTTTQEQVITLVGKQITELQEALSKIIATYTKLVGQISQPVLDVETFGVSAGMGTYILSCTVMFQAWKMLFRIPVNLRSNLISDSFLYDAPSGDLNEKMISLLGSANVKSAYKSKVSNGKIRIDVLLFFLVSALLSVKDASTEQVEYKDLLAYVRSVVKYTSNTILKQSSAIETLHNTKADSIRTAHNQDSRILTYVRLSSATPLDNNKRFKYEIVGDKIFHVQYDDQPVAFYDPVMNAGGEVVDFKENGLFTYTYASDYWFGPFTQVFEPTFANNQIAADEDFRKQIEVRLRKKNPVCIIGYGASGSGKTSTLVYASYTKYTGGVGEKVSEPGILIYLANNLAQSYSIDGTTYEGYTDCNVALYEFETDPDPTNKDPANQSICSKYPGADPNRTIHRIKRVGKDTFDENDVPYDPCNQASDARFVYKRQSDNTWLNEQKKGLDEEIVTYIDVKRNIAPSPNNPSSSRSHVVCILTFLNSANGETTTLIVCDFAGVENKFNCADQASLDNMGIPRLVEDEKKKTIARATQGMDPDLQKSVQSAALVVSDNATKVPILDVPTLNQCEKFANDITQSFSEISLPSNAPKAKDEYLSYLPDNSDTANLKKSKQSFAFDLTKIKEYTKVSTSSASIKNYKANETDKVPAPVFKAILDKYSKEDYQVGWDAMGKQYSAFTGEVAPDRKTVSIIAVIRMVVWYLSAFDKASVVYHSIFSTSIEPKTATLLATSDINQSFKVNICNIRVNEGLFINESLRRLRTFIGYTLQKSKTVGYAPFIDQCAPIQCNPYFRDCFGQNNYFDPNAVPEGVKSAASFGKMVETVMSVPNSDQITFCIFNVVNLSKRANNPPPSPYIDISDLYLEQERLKKILPKNYSSFESKLGFSVDQVNIDVIKRIKNHPLLKTKYKVSSDLIKSVNEVSDDLISGKGSVNDNVAKLIDVLKNFNSITAIGTLEFTDMMAKLALNQTVCNMRPPTAYPSDFEYPSPPKAAEPASVKSFAAIAAPSAKPVVKPAPKGVPKKK